MSRFDPLEMLTTDPEEARVFRAAQILEEKDPGRTRFPEVRGLCRTCDYALIRRREYSEIPTVVCRKLDKPHQVPLDVVECTGYSRRGEMGLRTMQGVGPAR